VKQKKTLITTDYISQTNTKITLYVADNK